MKALVVFREGGADHPLARFLKPGFGHCFVCVLRDGYWMRIDGRRGVPEFEVLTLGDFDLAAFYRENGNTVVETEQRTEPLWSPLALRNCVGLVKSVLCLRSWAVTPFQLYRFLTRPAMQLLPGFSSPSPQAAPPPPPTAEDPAIKAAQEKLRLAEKNRRGRAASILTPEESQLGDPQVSRPQARAAMLLGE